MFNKFTVITKTINMSDGEAVVTKDKDTEKEAMDLFYNNCSSYGTNPQIKACEVIVLAPNGDVIRMEKIDNSIYQTAEEVAE